MTATPVIVNSAYRHIAKQVDARELIALKEARLKWYDIAPAGNAVPDEIRTMAQAFLEKESAGDDWPLGRDLGFVILHRCGAEFYFLLLNTWRGSNELWETVYFKPEDAAPGFSLFPRDARHKPTFCVWEMAAVWSETQAWSAFLRSKRLAIDEAAYLASHYSGPA